MDAAGSFVTRAPPYYPPAPFLWKLEMFFNKQKEERLHKAYQQKTYDNLNIVEQHMIDLSEEDQRVLRASYDTYAPPFDFLNSRLNTR
jgi:hypothetical protein